MARTRTSRTKHPSGRAGTRRMLLGLTCLAVVAAGTLGAPSAAWAAKLAISNDAPPGRPVGSPIYDTATLGAGINPTGTITFRLYVPSDPTCAGTPEFTSVTAVTGGGFYMSSNYVPTAPGAYRWTASYSGDANDPAVASACSSPGAITNVTKQRPTLTGSATVSGKGGTTVATGNVKGMTPTGTMTYRLYGPGNQTCAGAPASSTTKPVAGNGAYTSAPFTATVGGAYRWVITYGGDANNESVSTSCAAAATAVNLAAGVTLTVSPAIVLAAASVTVTWNGIATPSSTDWIGLYAVGAPDSAVRAWRYTSGTAGGTASLRVPWLTLPGIYEVRLFAQNSYAPLATPARVTVILGTGV
jgi:hypothetical protein